MSRSEEILSRLFRAAAQSAAPAEMPFGFDTRVLARVKEAAPNGSALVALVARRVVIMACAVIGLAATGLYRASVSETNADATNEYGIVDNAIQNNLLE